MSEAQIGFLYKAASTLQQGQNKSLTTLRSYYLTKMRCRDVTKGYGLPDKHFSSKTRCSKCCLEWRKDTPIKVTSLKLSKKQRQRIRSRKARDNEKQIKKRKELFNSNAIEQICSFCKQTTTTTVLKPEKVRPVKLQTNENTLKSIIEKAAIKEKVKSTHSKKVGKSNKANKNEVNVYSNTAEVFYLNNKNNSLAKKEEQKVIKNNKKKKDKYAGLCQKAVLASAKLKEETNKQNKLNLFLKPSI